VNHWPAIKPRITERNPIKDTKVRATSLNILLGTSFVPINAKVRKVKVNNPVMEVENPTIPYE
jgi:hypothetical protein